MTGTEDVLEMIEDIVHAETGQHVFRDGRDGSFTGAAGALVTKFAIAGFGSLHDAWAEGAEALTDHWISTQNNPNPHGPEDEPANPYPAPKVSET